MIARGQTVPEEADKNYSKFKKDVLSKFTDKHGLVVNLDDGKPDGIGDAAWRTGLATICFAIEGDNDNTKKYLVALRDKCWKDGKPIRHPDSKETGNKTYSRDQFVPQMVACYFAHENGNAETRALAKELYKKFVDRIRKDDWRLNEGEAATINKSNQFAFFEVANKLDLVEGPKLKNAGDPAIREALILAMKEKSVELANPKVVEHLNNGEPVFQFYGVHLMFLEALVTIKCRPQTQDLIPTAKDLGRQAGHQNMAPFLWLSGDFDKLVKFLNDWPAEFNNTDYVWQRSKAQQEKAATDGGGKHEYPRLDYMLLRRLFDVELRRK